jgi:hypothetical protein
MKDEKLFTNVHDVTSQQTLHLQQHKCENLYPFTYITFSNEGRMDLRTLVHSTGLNSAVNTLPSPPVWQKLVAEISTAKRTLDPWITKYVTGRNCSWLLYLFVLDLILQFSLPKWTHFFLFCFHDYHWWRSHCWWW